MGHRNYAAKIVSETDSSPVVDRDLEKIDSYIGGRIQRTRQFRGLERTALAAALGIEDAQLAAYEAGLARIDVAKLRDIGRILNVKSSFFLKGLPRDLKRVAGAAAATTTSDRTTGDNEIAPIGEIFESIRCGTTRKMLVDLMLVITTSEASGQRWLN